jgi:hypothetical protein
MNFSKYQVFDIQCFKINLNLFLEFYYDFLLESMIYINIP